MIQNRAVKLDLDALKAHTAQLDTTGIDFAAFRDQPLSAGALRCLRYMHDVEYHTVCYLRDLLVTRAHRDHEVTSFLTFWNFEEYWHGEAIGRVLAEHGEVAHEARVQDLRGRLSLRDSLKPLVHGIGSLVAGREWLAVHMSWGAVNEWTTQAGYGRLAAREAHPVLSELLRRIMRQEGRHIDFYAAHAIEALEGNSRAQRVVRFTLQRVWRPVGASVMPRAEVDHMTRFLFSDPDGRVAAERVDRQIDRLPGQGGLHLLRRTVQSLAAA
jgi:hypothetical protein